MWKLYGMFNEFVFILLNVVFLPCVVSEAVGDYEELNGTLLHMNLYLCNRHFRHLTVLWTSIIKLYGSICFIVCSSKALTETAKKVVIVHTHYNFFSQLQ